MDAADRVVGRAPRSVVHAQGSRHRAVSILITDEAGRLLVQRRAASKDEFPGRWSPSASGHVESGEGYDETASRELMEEVGIDTDLTAVHRIGASELNSNEFTAVYVGRWDGAVRPDPAEVSEVRWVTLGALDAWMERAPDDFTPTFRTVYAGWRNHWTVPGPAR